MVIDVTRVRFVIDLDACVPKLYFMCGAFAYHNIPGVIFLRQVDCLRWVGYPVIPYLEIML